MSLKLAVEDSPKVVLASGSRFRAEMLHNAGVPFEIDPPGVDEASVRESLAAEEATTADVATALAELKAIAISRKHPNALVLGSDQMLDCNGIWFEKPEDLDHARATLTALSGKRHTLVTAAVFAQGGSRVWHTLDTVEMTMRTLSADFIERYVTAMGDDVRSSVGAYQLEGLGAQMFSGVKGDFFTVLGLPLLQVLDYLRTRGVLMS